MKKYLHIILIILGTIFISLPIFHINMWFDEAYSVGMANNTFADIWVISSNDVHPILYYWILHIVYLIFGSNIYLYRLITMLPLAILGIIGYTHIKKDFGEKTGFLFSFFVFFLPVTCVYSADIRMYTWAMLLVTLMSIYAYRIYKEPTAKNWILFSIFSVLSAYTHYYALLAATIINLILLIYFIKYKRENIKTFIISAIGQIIIYSPWLLCLLKQAAGFTKGFWIPKPNLELFLNMFIFQFTGNLDIEVIKKGLAIIFGIIVLGYTIYCFIRNLKNNKKENNLPLIWSIGTYFIVILSIYIISLIKPLLYPRYLLTLTGLFIFFIAYSIALRNEKIPTILVCLLTLVIAIICNYNVIKMNYDTSNAIPISYVKEDLQNNDMIIFENESGSGFVMSMEFTNIQNCFYDFEHWNVEPAYKAFGKDMLYIDTLEKLDNYTGRIWVIDSDDYILYDKLIEQFGENITLIKQDKYNTKYHGYKYAISLIEKK